MRSRSLRSCSTAVAAGAALLSAAAPALAHPLDIAVGRQTPALGSYFVLGVEHIVTGIDHLLFLLGLVAVAARLRDVLWAVTAFTLAHSVTLACAALGVVVPDPRWVEPLIALSIAYVGVENLFARVHGPRARLAFGFGLLHGLGFAGALAEIGLPGGQRLTALLLFNLGVESGQLLLLAALLPLLWRLQRWQPSRRFGLPALSAALVAVGLVWAGARLPGLEGDGGVARASGERAETSAGSKPAGETATGADMPRSTYPASAAPADPRVAQLCATLHELPRARRAACAGRATGLTLTSECERTLNGAVAAGALALDDRAARRCVDAARERYRDCAFTSARVLPPIEACTQVWRGARALGASCRSSLECEHGLHCRGAGPLDPGTCAAPAAAGATCDTAADPLASYLPHAERDHPQCDGTCIHARCRARNSR